MNTKIQNKQGRSLRGRILLTASLLTIIRLGNFIPLPYMDHRALPSFLETGNNSTNVVAQVITTFSGSGNNSFGLLSLGILPYINASIIVQLLTTAIPSLSKMQKEEGEYGRRKTTDYVRYLTFIWAIIESIGIVYSIRGLIFDWSFWTASQISITLITGSMIVLWFSELITKKGLGNGSSLLICFNIVSSLPDQIKVFLFSLKDQTNYFDKGFLLIGIFLITTLGCIYMNEAVIKIPLVSSRQLLQKNTSKSKDFGNSRLPLRVNQAGVMPLVFTSYAMVLLSSGLSLVKSQGYTFSFFNQLPFFNQTSIFWAGKILFWSIYASLIFFFTYFYSTIVLDPKDVAERFQKNSVVILGIRPGVETKTYLSRTLRRIARINALFLISNIIGLQVIESFFNLNVMSLRGLGFTSQLILVNVLIDTLKRIRGFINEEKTTS